MTAPRMFPVLWPSRRVERAALARLSCPRAIAWRIVAPHAAQAERNHGQTLEVLARRGGLSPQEMALVLTDRPLSDFFEVSNTDAVATIVRVCAAEETPDEWEARMACTPCADCGAPGATGCACG